jgi:hypothetical protein
MERAMSQYSFRAAQIATYLGPSRFLDDPALDPFPAGDPGNEGAPDLPSL